MTTQWFLIGMSFALNVILVWYLIERQNIRLALILLILTGLIIMTPQSLPMMVVLAAQLMLSLIFNSHFNQRALIVLVFLLGGLYGLLFIKRLDISVLWAVLCLISCIVLAAKLLLAQQTSALPGWLYLLGMCTVLLFLPIMAQSPLLGALTVMVQLYILLKFSLLNDHQATQPGVADIQAAERSRIYQNIHDDVGAELLRLVYQLDDTRQKDQVKAVMQRLRKAVAQTTQLSTDVQQLSDELMALCREAMVRANIDCRTKAHIDYNYVFSNTHPSGFVRIMNELLSNIIRHANANNVSLTMHSKRNLLEIHLTDDGQGLKLDPNGLQLGRGLKGLRKRALAMGAQINWKNGPNGGLETIHGHNQNSCC